jgi:hypothetical protein
MLSRDHRGMNARRVSLLVAVLLTCRWMMAQQPLSNDNILNMKRAGFSDQFILERVERSPGSYDTSAAGLDVLENAGISPAVLSAIRGPHPVAVAKAPAPSNRLYIEERVKTTSSMTIPCEVLAVCRGHYARQMRSLSLEVAREVERRCGETITVTNNRGTANYFLRIEEGASTLYQQDGDVAYVSPARWSMSNLAKDVCSFAATAR